VYQGYARAGQLIVGTIAEGHPAERVLQSWPQLTIEDVTAALRFASALAAEATGVPAYDEVDAE
jgi:uncharacterized protein (DUF433 family)